MKRFVLMSLGISQVLFFTQCKKDASRPFYENSTYQSENTVTVSSVRLFTRGTEITDTQYIRNFITRQTTQAGFPNPFLFGVTIEPLDPRMSLKISFHENNQASVERYSLQITGPLENHMADVNVIDPTQLLLVEKDSIYTADGFGDCVNLRNSAYAFAPGGDCYLSGTPPSVMICKLRYSIPVSIQSKQLLVPMINIIAVRGYSPSLYCMNSRYGNVRNSFRSSVIGTLQTNDTIGIQIKTVALRKL